MVGARLRRERQIGAEEGWAKFGYQLLGGITFIAPPFAAEFTGKPRGVPRAVRQLVQQRRVIALGVGEAFEGWQLHAVGFDGVESPVAAMANIGVRRGGKMFGRFDAGGSEQGRSRPAVKMVGQAVDLF